MDEAPLDSPTITVEVAYADASRQTVRRLVMRAGSTVMEAIAASGLGEVLPAGAIDPARLGIFSRPVSSDDVLHHGDRVEVYRPLTLDPMEARRRRARRN